VGLTSLDPSFANLLRPPLADYGRSRSFEDGSAGLMKLVRKPDISVSILWGWLVSTVAL